MKITVIFAALLACACGSAARPPAPATPASHPGSAGGKTVTVPRTVVTPDSATSVPELLEEADARARAAKWLEAAALYDRAYRVEPDGAEAERALFGAGDAFDRAGDNENAVTRYELVARRFGKSVMSREAVVRGVRIHTFLGRYARAGALADAILNEPESLAPFARVAVYSGKALALLEGGDTARADYYIEKARDVVETRSLDQAGEIPRDLAQLYFALGESRRARAERIVFVPPPQNFAATLEERCQLLLDAQSAYSDTMRAHDAHWSAMAGYRVTELYQRLHQDLMKVEPPPSAETERQRQLFTGAVRLRYSILLTKAKSMAEHTLAMATRTGEQSSWVERARAALQEIDQALTEEKRLLDSLPYTRADFEQYFADMEAKARAAAPAPKAGTPGAKKAP